VPADWSLEYIKHRFPTMLGANKAIATLLDHPIKTHRGLKMLNSLMTYTQTSVTNMNNLAASASRDGNPAPACAMGLLMMDSVAEAVHLSEDTILAPDYQPMMLNLMAALLAQSASTVYRQGDIDAYREAAELNQQQVLEFVSTATQRISEAQAQTGNSGANPTSSSDATSSNALLDSGANATSSSDATSSDAAVAGLLDSGANATSSPAKGILKRPRSAASSGGSSLNVSFLDATGTEDTSLNFSGVMSSVRALFSGEGLPGKALKDVVLTKCLTKSYQKIGILFQL
jgi:hypothetical protein